MIDEGLMFRIAELCKKPDYEFTSETLAFHEAGHAVVQRVLGLKPSKTAIDRKKLIGIAITGGNKTPAPNAKHSSLKSMPLEFRRLINCRWAAISKAGEICERMHAGKSVKGVVLTGSPDDLKARAFLGEVGLSALSAYPDRLAKKILTDNWQEVVAIAEQLLEKGAIYWEDPNE